MRWFRQLLAAVHETQDLQDVHEDADEAAVEHEGAEDRLAGNRFLTFCSNLLTGLNLTDMETCYKVFRREVGERVTIRSKRFTVEPELTARFARMRARIYEVPVRYAGRDYAEGKKITWRDGIAALWAIARFRLFP